MKTRALEIYYLEHDHASSTVTHANRYARLTWDTGQNSGSDLFLTFDKLKAFEVRDYWNAEYPKDPVSLVKHIVYVPTK